MRRNTKDRKQNLKTINPVTLRVFPDLQGVVEMSEEFRFKLTIVFGSYSRYFRSDNAPVLPDSAIS